MIKFNTWYPTPRQPIPYSDIFKDLPQDGKQLYLFYLKSRQGKMQVRVYDTPSPIIEPGCYVAAWAPIPHVTTDAAKPWVSTPRMKKSRLPRRRRTNRTTGGIAKQ